MTPFLFDPYYKNSYEEIIYFGSRDYTERKLIEKILVNHSKYRTEDQVTYLPYEGINKERLGTADFYAFGIVVNPFSTLLLPIDIDGSDVLNVKAGIEKMMRSLPNEIAGIDLLESSHGNFHLHVGLYKRRNVRSFLIDVSSIACPGYVKSFSCNYELVLRTSQKFKEDGSWLKPAPRYIRGWRQTEFGHSDSTIFSIPTKRTETQKKVTKPFSIQLRN